MVNLHHIQQYAAHYQLDLDFVQAIIEVESSGNEFAWRTEHAYRYLWDVKRGQPFRSLRPAEMNTEVAPEDFTSPIGSRNTEWLGQQASWGPMQVMGAVARELGFKGHFPQLCGEKGVEYGCRLLAKLVDRHFDKHGLAGVAAAYNAGSPRVVDGKFANQEYVDKVFRAMRGTS